MTMSFVAIKSSHNLQDIIFNNIQRRKPRLGIKLKETWQRAIIIQFISYIGGIKVIFLLLQNVFRMDQYVLELVEWLDNLLANL